MFTKIIIVSYNVIILSEFYFLFICGLFYFECTTEIFTARSHLSGYGSMIISLISYFCKAEIKT